MKHFGTRSRGWCTCNFLTTFTWTFWPFRLFVPSGKSRPTVHVMVNSLLVPPPPPTPEGATTGTTMRQQQQNSEPTCYESTQTMPTHTGWITYPWQQYWNILPLQTQYHRGPPCQMQHLNVNVGTLPLKKTERLKFSCSASSLAAQIMTVFSREVTVGLWFQFHNWISVYSFSKVLICRGLCG